MVMVIGEYVKKNYAQHIKVKVNLHKPPSYSFGGTVSKRKKYDIILHNMKHLIKAYIVIDPFKKSF